MTRAGKSDLRFQQRVVSLIRRMDWLRGLRAGVALCAPLVLGYITGWPNLGWAGLGGFEAILADTGGPYRTRMGSLITLSLGGASGLLLGAMAGSSLQFALPATLIWCFVWTYLIVLGQPFSSASILVQVIYICGVGTPAANWHQALDWALLLLAGGAWAALLSLFLWPLDAYRPAREAVAACYSDLASFLASIAELAERPGQRTALWHRLAQHHQYRIRRSVEHGWTAVANIRANSRAETVRGRQLVVLLEHADLLIARTIALAEHIESGFFGTPANPTAQTLLSHLRALRTAELGVAALLVRRSAEALAGARTQRIAMEHLPQTLDGDPGSDKPASRFLLAQIAQAASLLESSLEAALLLRLGKPAEPAPPPGASSSHFGYVMGRLASLRQGWRLDALSANLNPRSLALRHAVRVSLVCGADVAIILLLHIDHGYWLLLTSIIVLQPHVSGTLRRGLERIGGTVAGGILAALLAIVLRSQMVTAAALFPLALLSLATLPVSYAAFAFFLTPTFVLAWLPYSGDWKLALIRIVNTIAGALISILAMKLLFPHYERERIPQILRASLAADRRYLERLSENWRTGVRSSRLLADARRAAGLAHNDTEESLERLLAESWPRRAPFAQFATAFVTYLRRFAQSVTTLAAIEGESYWKQSPATLNRLDLLNRRLVWLEERVTALEPHAASVPWPESSTQLLIAGGTENHPGELQMQRIERQTDILHRQLRALQDHGWFPISSVRN
ncbi:MAG TPA: FUSC family protein [Terracidiphilus sp.]|nr:FUSC family protein [Terracidiphilus sp.]